MSTLLGSHEFWTAITSLAWPIIAILAFYQLRPTLESMLKRESMTIKVAGMEISVTDAATNLGKQMADIQERMSLLETTHRQSEPQAEIPIKENSGSHKRKANNLLWVDDYPSNNAFLIEKMRENGIEVTISLSTEDALKRLERGGFDAIITDLGRQEGEVDNPFAGLDLIKSLKQQNSKLPVLVFAGGRGLENREKLVRAGASSVTSSGIDVMKFVEHYLEVK